jgi:hypothetical protein
LVHKARRALGVSTGRSLSLIEAFQSVVIGQRQ